MNQNMFTTKLAAAIGLVAISTLFLDGCFSDGCGGNAGNQAAEKVNNTAAVQPSREEIKSLSFSDRFKPIEPKMITESVFKLIGEDYAVLTAGTPSKYNSMVASWGGWGILFNKPAAFSMLRANRYTLELMRREQKYTMSFFDTEFKDDITQFGLSSGRNSDEKMKKTKLTSVQTPSGNTVFKEAKLIVECKLIQVTTVSPDDFLVEENKKFVVDAFAEAGEYHKMVVGEITNVWIRQDKEQRGETSGP